MISLKLQQSNLKMGATQSLPTSIDASMVDNKVMNLDAIFDIICKSDWTSYVATSKLLAMGFMRTIEDKHKMNIPLDIKYLCLHINGEYFTNHGENIVVNKYGNIAK